MHTHTHTTAMYSTLNSTCSVIALERVPLSQLLTHCSIAVPPAGPVILYRIYGDSTCARKPLLLYFLRNFLCNNSLKYQNKLLH